MSLVYPSSSATPRLDPNGLYILLSDIGGNNRFHWALYLSQPAPSIDATESDVPYGDERAHPQTQTQTQDQTQPRNQNPAHAQAHKGTIFHLLSDPNDDTSWTYSVLPNTPISSLERPFLVAMKIGDIDPVLHEALAERLAQIVEDHQYYSVRFREGMTSRVWIKEAVWALNEEGYINLVQSGSKEVVEKIENEAMMLAMRCSYRSEQMVLTSSWLDHFLVTGCRCCVVFGRCTRSSVCPSYGKTDRTAVSKTTASVQRCPEGGSERRA